MAQSSLPPYAAVASDMDGTLLTPEHTATQETADVLWYISTVKKTPFVFATGRHHVDVLATKKKLGLSGYVITSNGARVHDDAGNVIIKNDMPADIARRLALEAIDEPEIATSVYQEDEWLINRDVKDLAEFYEDNKDVFFSRQIDVAHHPSYDGVYKVYYTADNRDRLERLHALEDRLRATYDQEEISIAYSLPFCLEVTGGGVNKGAALGQLLDEHMFPHSDPTGTLPTGARRQRLLQQCIAFGDGDNDFPLLTCVGHGCLMGNAQQALLDKITAHVKEHLESGAKLETIKKNTEDGVAQKLKEVFAVQDEDVTTAVAAKRTH